MTKKVVLLHDAARAGDVAAGLEALGAVATTHADAINSRDRLHRTPLHLAAFNGKVKFVELLISFECDVNKQAQDNTTALHFAVLRDHTEVVIKLLEAGATIDAQVSMIGLFFYILHNHSSYIQTKKGKTALMITASRGSLATVQALLSYHADVSLKDRQGKTAKDLAKTNLIRNTLEEAETVATSNKSQSKESDSEEKNTGRSLKRHREAEIETKTEAKTESVQANEKLKSPSVESATKVQRTQHTD